jgi:hypothetical protein
VEAALDPSDEQSNWSVFTKDEPEVGSSFESHVALLATDPWRAYAAMNLLDRLEFLLRHHVVSALPRRIILNLLFVFLQMDWTAGEVSVLQVEGLLQAMDRQMKRDEDLQTYLGMVHCIQALILNGVRSIWVQLFLDNVMKKPELWLYGRTEMEGNLT